MIGHKEIPATAMWLLDMLAGASRFNIQPSHYSQNRTPQTFIANLTLIPSTVPERHSILQKAA